VKLVKAMGDIKQSTKASRVKGMAFEPFFIKSNCLFIATLLIQISSLEPRSNWKRMPNSNPFLIELHFFVQFTQKSHLPLYALKLKKAKTVWYSWVALYDQQPTL
jgi:hypothetical protein